MTAAALPTQSAQPNLTTAQHLLWLGQKLAPESPLYNMAFLFTLSGEIEPAHFQAAFQALIERSDALRMVIEEVDGVPQRRVLPQLDYEVPVLDFSNGETPQAAARGWAENRSRELFKLSERLFDTALIRLGPDCCAWYMCQHHVITDIQSVQLIYQTVGDFYHRSIAGTLSKAPTLPAYSDVSLPSPSSRAASYWQQQQANSVDLYHRSATQVSPRTHRVSCELGPERTAALKQLAMTSDAKALTPQLSLFNLVSGILLAYLHRVSSSDQVAFATPAHGRPTTLLKETIGVFIELFPLQTAIEPGETFTSLLRKVAQASGGMLRYAQPGASQFAPSRDVNVVLNFIHARLSDFDGRSVSSEWIHPGAGDPRHHLRLQVHDFDDRGSLQLHFDFNCDLFEPALQERATGHFLALVDAVLADLNQPIAGVEIVTGLEKTHLLELAKCDRTDITKTVVQQFEAQVEKTPDAVAISCENETLTYDQLNARANQLSHYLQKQGVTTETPVGICLRRSVEMLVAIWGVLKAGGAYVPMDPSHPHERIVHILKDTQACRVLTQSEFSARLNSHAETIQLDTLDLTLQPNNNLKNAPGINQLAYLLYTSGSTGKPKGVEVEHRGLANYVSWAIQQYVRGRTLAFPLFSPFTFDLTVTSIYVPLLSGGQVMIYPERDEAIDLSLQRIFQDNAVDVIKLTPSHLALVQGMAIGSRVKTLILGGEDLKTSLAGAIAHASDHPLKIYNEYGPTEATVGCMIHRFELQPDAPKSVAIGKPAAGSEIYLLDEHLNLVPQGAVGEIFIGGPGLARGYLNRPDLTAERFVYRGDQRLYRTGDLGRWQENGQLTYLGRSDRQVKIHGTRIELGEIEAALVAHPDVSASAVSLVQSAAPVQSGSITYCTRCGIASNYPGITFDHESVCDICQSYETYRDRTEQYFKSIDEFKSRLDTARQRKQGDYDCMMLLSGGKDSTYALAQLVTMGFKVFAFTLDNGYISEQAKDNIRRVVKTLGVDHQFGTTPAMNDIFVDSLNRHCNVCNGCFKTIYTLSMKLAYELGIPCIVTGLSRGQFFETRLTEEWFTELFGQSEFNVDQIDETILTARKAYHRADDAVSRLMDVEVFQGDDIFEMVEIIDFYRYCDVELAEMLSFLTDQVPWIRPSDTGRSTNCLINNVGIYLHTQKRGYHNYALPYSWDVRMGHKTPEAAIDELNDEIDVAEVERILQEIGYEDAQINKAQLVAYYVGQASTADLRHFLAQRLPSNLVPAYFTQLERMPLTANGKVDFATLPDPNASRPELQSEFVAPATAIEKMLAKLWQQVLKMDRIGIHDNFYELGGDSIMAIQIAARMSETGFRLSPNQIFQHPTLAQLSAAVAPESADITTEDLTGVIPLTPIQQAFFEQHPTAPEQFTQMVVLDVAEILDLSVLTSALTAVVNHHDSLRLTYTQTKTGWEQRYGEPVSNVATTQIDISTQPHPQATISETIAQLQTQLDLTRGDLVRAVLFNLGDRQQLGLVIHHLAVDALSWLTIIQDLETAYQKLSKGETPSLPLKTTSFKTWATGLKEISLPQSEIDYWLSQPESVAQLGVAPQTEATARTVSRQLSHSLTQMFLQTSRARPQELLLTALTLAIRQHTGKPMVQVALEGHGREETVIPNSRLVRTVGWFTSLFPVTLTAQPEPGETLRSVKTTLEQIPQNGIGYGILRYLRGNEAVADQPQPEILFNYLGTLEQLLPPKSMFRFAQPLQVSPKQTRSHLLDISAFIREDQLHIDWRYSGLDDSTTQAIADGMMQHLQMLLGRSGSKATAADFPLAKLDSKKLDKLSALLNKADRAGGQG